MPWFKVDDNLAFHAKTVAAGNAAIGLWVRAGAWSANTLTEGFIPNHMISAFNGGKLVSQLVACGLWERVDGGYQFHDWQGYQPSKASVEAEREAARERQRRAREKAKLGRDTKGSAPDSHAGSHGVTPPEVTVPPSLPDPSLLNEKESGARKRGTRISADWMPDPEVKAKMLAERPGVDFRTEHQNFVDHFLAASGASATKVDWNAAWRKWMRSARAGGANGHSSSNGQARPASVADALAYYNGGSR